MSIAFATNLSNLRRERGITQKTAAEELGISQALLSHYEKGIRECNLDFVIRAAAYYDVTTDYLLGVSDTKRTGSDLLDTENLPSDSQIRGKTLIRAFSYLLSQAENDSELSEIYFSDFFSLAIKKYISLVNKNDKKASQVCDVVLNSTKISKQKTSNDINEDTPVFIKTVDSHAQLLIKKALAKFTD